MEGQRYSRKRREEMRRRRRRRVRRRRMMIGICCVVIVAAVINGIIGTWKAHREETRVQRQLDETRAVIALAYEQFLAEAGLMEEPADAVETSAEVDGDTEGEGAAFALWLSEKYPEEMKTTAAEAAADGVVSSEEAYEVFGATMQVLRNDYRGYLKDAQTAAKHGIYIQQGEDSGNVTVSIAGDLCLEEDGFVIDQYDLTEDLKQCISPEILETAVNADIFYLNHEYTVSERGEALAGKLYTFRAKPERMKILEEMGTDLVSLANNHIYDYGEEGMLDTLEYLDEAEIPYVGGGRNLEEAARPVYYIVNGVKIGFVAASNAELTLYTPAAGEDSPGILEAYDTAAYDQIISRAAKECDYLIAYIHWGPEDVNQYAEYQTAQGKEFLDAGADIVVGGHPHVLQGIEYMDGKPVIYSMGDFWFNGETKYTGLLNLEITPAGSLERMSFTPCLQTGFTTQYLSDAREQREMFDFLEQLSPNIKISDDGTIAEQ